MSASFPEPHDSPENPADRPQCDQTLDASAAELVRILDQYLADLKAGQAPSREQLIARHPALASQLEACLAGLEFIHGAESSTAGRHQKLGDFCILREIGRGGMGAVFEAQQLSLGRRVALKVLRFGGVSSPEAIERFQREAETVAKLHHTNIVPIFAVGSERGVNYYAMQFIDGRSLDKALAEHGGPLPSEQVAQWGLQAAEALAHAHERGVVHRDVKPSNLLLDNEQRIWLTDFGLARRLDDVTLSMTGVLLGTPRYMSPEQAVASKKRVDHRSDLFSLGATLYELLAGKPAFGGDSPHDVIQQILEADPAPIRQVNPSVPRDLETVVMKCMAKEPDHRYDSARDLASDLRALLDGRPIRARRATAIEKAARWMRQHQRNVTLAGSAAAVTLLVTVIGILAWSGYAAWQQASLKLDAANPPLVAEIIDQQGTTVRVDTLPMHQEASLPAGDFNVRVSAIGNLSQTFGVSLERGHDMSFKVNLNDSLLLPPQEIERTYSVVRFGGDDALVLWSKEGIALQKRAGPHLGWTMKLDPKQSTALQSVPGFRWPWNTHDSQYSGYGTYDLRPWVARNAVDVNSDGIGDLICAARHQAWLMAVSGQDGSILWFAARGERLIEPPADEWPPSNMYGSVLGEPIVRHDYDGDQIADVIATFVDVASNAAIQKNQYDAHRWVEAISGKSGETIWRYDLPDQFFQLPPNEDVPYDLRWFARSDGGMTMTGGGQMQFGRYTVRNRSSYERTGAHVYIPTPPALVTLSGQDRLALVAGRNLLLLDPKTGKPSEAPIDVGTQPAKAPQWADLDGDGSSELVILESVSVTSYPSIPTAKLHVWSYVQQRTLWTLNLDANWPQRPSWTVDAPTWPLVSDLNQDGKAEVIVPHGSSRTRGAFGGRLGMSGELPWGAITVRAGVSGQQLWSRRIISMDSQVDTFIDGPDIDGDGSREVFAVALVGHDSTIYVDCLSGANGRTLWSGQHTPRLNGGQHANLLLAPATWWQSGADGWPQLLVHCVDEEGGSRDTVLCAFSAGTGELSHYGYGIDAALPAHVDSDQIEDLFVFTNNATRLDSGGNLKCIRGVGREVWKRLGDFGEPLTDVNGDGIRDFVRSWGDGTLLAYSGATGKEIWQSKAVPSVNELFVSAAETPDDPDSPAPANRSIGDLDHDGAVDLLICEKTAGGRGRIAPLHAVSARSGRRLWTVSEVTARMIGGLLASTASDLDGDGRGEVLWLAALDHDYPERTSFSSMDLQLWLFVVDGQSGNLKWSRPVSPQFGLSGNRTFPYQLYEARVEIEFGDLDRDGTLDVLVPAINEKLAFGFQALSGENGSTIWAHYSERDPSRSEPFQNWSAPRICDLDADLRSEVVWVEPSNTRKKSDYGSELPNLQVTVLHGETGRLSAAYPTSAGYSPYHSHLRSGSRAPILLRAERGQRIAIYLPGTEAQLLIIDATGIVQQRPIRNPNASLGVWACDADGDRADEVMFISDSQMIVANVEDLNQPIWTRPLSSIGQQQILEIGSHAGKPKSLIVLAADPTDNEVQAIDAATGDLVWTCPGPIPRDPSGAYVLPNKIEVLGAAKNQTPLVFYATGFIGACRQAVLSKDTAPRPQMLVSFARRGVDVATARTGGLENDPRWKRDLPWRLPPSERFLEVASFVAWAMFFSFTLIVLPVAFLARLVYLRRFSLQLLLLLPLILGVFMVSALLTAPFENDFRVFSSRLTISFIFSPPTVGIGVFVWWLIRRQWRRALLWTGIIVLVSVVLGTIAMFVNLRSAPLLPEESIDWTGWYLIFFAGAYATSWVLMVILPLAFLARAVRSYYRKRRSLRADREAVDWEHPAGDEAHGLGRAATQRPAEPTIAADTRENASMT